MALVKLTEYMENICIIFVSRSDQMGKFGTIFHKQGDYLFLTKISGRTGQKAEIKYNTSVV